MDDVHRRWILRSLALAYGLAWGLLAIEPRFPKDWLLENLLVFLAAPVVWKLRNELPVGAFVAMFVFFLLHAVGAHYTYAEVPYDDWARALTGHAVNEVFGFERNHFDRLVHFLYGLLLTPAFTHLLDARLAPKGAWRWLLPFSFMASHAVVYEMIEWGAAMVFGGELGQAYLGTQGDVWDAQRDSALALAGTAVSLLFLRRWRPATPR